MTLAMAMGLADIHLSHTPPAARREETDWYAAMERTLVQVEPIAAGLPLLCAGDVFDRCDPPPALINFAMDTLPYMYAVPGQHDLPWHGLSRMGSSAFGTLVKAKRIRLLSNEPRVVGDMVVVGFAWGVPLQPVQRVPGKLHVAVVHHYCWMRGRRYLNSPAEANYRALSTKLAGFDVCIFGDNHLPFTVKSGQQTIYNCGGLFRRHVDEEALVPSLGAIDKQGEVRRCYLSTQDEVFTSRAGHVSTEDVARGRIERVVRDLAGDQMISELDYREAVRQCILREKDPAVASFLKRILDGIAP